MPALHFVTIPTTPDTLDDILRAEGHEVTSLRHTGAAKTMLNIAFGELAPHHFLWIPTRGIATYSTESADQMMDHASDRLGAARAQQWGLLSVRSMPTPDPWTPERPYQFAVRVLPTRRERNPETGRTTEREVIARTATAQERDAAYEDWLADRIAPWNCAQLGYAWMTGYHPGPITDNRKGRAEATAAAYLEGEITVTDSDQFNRMLLQGIGQHRNRGYGTMLLGQHCGLLS